MSAPAGDPAAPKEDYADKGLFYSLLNSQALVGLTRIATRSRRHREEAWSLDWSQHRPSQAALDEREDRE